MNRKLQFVITLFSLCLVGVLLLGAVSKQTSSPEETYRHIGVFTEVLSKIKSEYVEEPDMKNVTLGALNGLLESLDPYASYLSADQFKQYQKAKAEAAALMKWSDSRTAGSRRHLSRSARRKALSGIASGKSSTAS